MMMRLHYLTLCFCPVLLAVSVPNVRQNWENDKVEILSGLIDVMSISLSGHVTVIASQNVYNENGTLTEIRTVELLIPNMIYKKRSVDPGDFLETLKKNDDEFDDTLLKIQRDFRQTFDIEHIDKQTGFQKFSETGEIELEVYATKDETLYQDLKGVTYYAKENLTHSDKVVLAGEFKQYFNGDHNTTIAAGLIWDENGTFDSYSSDVEPVLLAQVDEASDTVDEDMLDAAIEAVSYSALKHPDGVAKMVSSVMSENYPDYTWLVTHWQEEDVTSANHDIFIKVTYHNIDLGEDYLEYTLYGVKN